jgi:hypothetical protein
MAHSSMVKPGPEQGKIGRELREQLVSAGKKVVEMPGGHAGAGLRQSGARKHLRPVAAVV